MKKKINEIIYQCARYMEIVFSIIILVVILLMIIPILHDFFETPLLETNTDLFRQFLSNTLTLVVGVEFVKMLCKHTTDTLLEVLLFATARQMVVEHLDPPFTLLGVISIALLFAARKYLLLKTPSSMEKDMDE